MQESYTRDEVKQTPEEWLATDMFAALSTMDRDGWKDKPWNEPITRREFIERSSWCSMMYTPEVARIFNEAKAEATPR